MFKKIIFFCSLLLTGVLSIFPRAVEVLNNNPIFGFDQGRDYLAVKDIVIGHKLTLIGAELGAGSAGISGIFQGPGFFYLLAIPFAIFNGNPTGGVLLMFILSILTILMSFVLGRKIFGNFDGILIALLVSISPIFISGARFVWNPNSPPLFILLMLYFLYLFIEKKKAFYLFLSAFFAGFIYNLEFGVSIPLCFSLAVFCVYLLRWQFKKYLFLLVGFIVAFSPMIVFEVRHKFMALTGLISYLTVHHKSSGTPSSSFIVDHAKSIIFGFQNTFVGLNNFYIGLIFWLALIILSIYFVSKEKNNVLKQFIIFLLILIPGAYFIFIFLKNSIWTYYLTDLSFAYIFLFTYLIFSAYLKKFYKLFFVLIILTFVLIIFALSSSIQTTIHDYSDYGGTAKVKGKIDAIDFIYKDAKGRPFGLLVFAPPVYTYPYDYLLWWYGENKYHYLPYTEEKGTFYLLIEQDPDKPWSYNGWLQTVIKTGKIVYTKTLPSGFIIQKRISNE